ncbi:MAG TPA: hypothetical protein VLA76_08335 [Candidatus Angelobacter sp.]|nr:hypothetical protein [Candidatus Angelobacter sp.]
MNDLGSLLEFLAYLGSILFFALLIRELGRPDGAASLGDLLALSREPRSRQHIAEDEPPAWNLERLHPRRQWAGVADRSPRPVAGRGRSVLPERPMTACEGS